jgi:signal transduction histidine kinase
MDGSDAYKFTYDGVDQDKVENGLLEKRDVMPVALVHELSNLLTIMLGSLEQLRRQSLDEKGHQRLGHAEAAAYRAGQLLHQCIDKCSELQTSAGRAHADCN